ncbi:MAG TPA: NADPH-dependent FMN reductase [Solirubrobacteraceae bacterium]|nr:NADPH-dependent FMN reductase [Solirubrobacteraceae bacterium]
MAAEASASGNGSAPRAAVRLLVVLGSVTPRGRLRRALEEALSRTASQQSLEAELIDLAERRVSFADGRDPSELSDDTAAVIAAVEAADAVLFATPIYRGSMTGALKNVFDLLPVPALHGKVAALAALGASDHHFLGAERHLRDVLSFFGALVTPVAVYLSAADFVDGVPGERAAAALDELIAGAVSIAAALRLAGGDRTRVRLGPSPLAARALRARAGG